MSYKIAIVDDHVLIAKAIAGVIDHFKNYTVLYEVENGKALMDKFADAKNIPDIVLLDISMPIMDGFATAKWLKEKHPDVLVLALSMQDDDMSLIRMIRSGAKGYLLKNIHPEELEHALDELTTRGYYYPEWAAGKVLSNLSSDPDGKNIPAELTQKEYDFLRHCCSELTYKEIGTLMACSARTVEGYRDTLFSKLGLKTRVGLVMYALKSGKISI